MKKVYTVRIEENKHTYSWVIRYEYGKEGYRVADGEVSRLDDVTAAVNHAIKEHQNSR